MIHKLILFSLVFTACKAQEAKPLLIEQTHIADLSKLPIYDRLTETVDGELDWRKAFSYMDNIDIYKITYLSDGLKVKGLMVRPKKAGKYPCVIYNRGGNQDMGALKFGHGALLLGPIAKEGYIVIASQYRGNSGSEGREEFGGSDVNDVTILPEVLKEIDGADIDKIAMYGWSRGGMMTYIALTKMDNIKAAIVGGAVADSYKTIQDRPGMEDVFVDLVPDYLNNKEAELDKRSAVKWVDKMPKDVPILILHGTSDWRVKPEQSLEMAQALERERIPYRLIMFEGGDHGIREHKAEVNRQVFSWLKRFLKEGEVLPNMEYHGK